MLVPVVWGTAGRAMAQERARSQPAAWFRLADTNSDGTVSVEEWQAAFDRLDANHDRYLDWGEILAARRADDTNVDLAVRSAAFRAGYERGRTEGRQAGIEDKPRHWDLEGQRELQSADSGYTASIGSRPEYQDGYRAGFRRGYAEGFGPRR
jgi:hypothetical protein